MNYAYVYYFSDSSKLSEFIVSYESLKATHPKYPIYCVLGEACINQKFVDFLTSIGVGFLICDTHVALQLEILQVFVLRHLMLQVKWTFFTHTI